MAEHYAFPSTVKDPRQPSVSVYWVLRTSYGISRASYRPLASSVQPHRLIMWVFPSLYVRTDQYGFYGSRTIHLRVTASMWQKYTRTPIDHTYSSDRKRMISYGLLTGYRSVRLSKPHLETEGLRHIAPCAEDRCMNYTKNYISIRPAY